MSIALYIDENVARQVTTGLRLRGVDVFTVQEVGRTGYPDEIILERANELNRVLFSQDDLQFPQKKWGRLFNKPFVFKHRDSPVLGLRPRTGSLPHFFKVPSRDDFFSQSNPSSNRR